MKRNNNLQLSIADIRVIDRYSIKYLSDCYEKAYGHTVSLESKIERQTRSEKFKKEKF